MIQRLFCKPVPVKHSGEIIHYKNEISFRSLEPDKDLAMIHKWMCHPSTHRFWQMNKPISLIASVYTGIIAHPALHSYIGLYNDEPVCLVDVYAILADELGDILAEVNADDCGLHLLMAPVEKRIPRLTLKMFQTFLDYYFSFPMASRIYGEPDVDNEKSIRMIRSCGFEYMRDVKLSYKTASLHILTKQKFHDTPEII